MTYAVTPGTLKATQARKWGDEMLRACRARNISLNELGRQVGHGHTAIDHYRRGSILPRTETAFAIADVLNWPRLKTLILQYRTYKCARPGCLKTFRNDGGGPKKFCSDACQRINESLKLAERRRRQAGQTGSARSRSAADRRMKGVITTLQGELAVLHEQVAAMCRACEPEGLCRQLECPLRSISPLPFHEHTGEATTDFEIRSASRRTPALREAMQRRWARPGEREAQSARSKAMHDARTPEQHREWVQSIVAAKHRP